MSDPKLPTPSPRQRQLIRQRQMQQAQEQHNPYARPGRDLPPRQDQPKLESSGASQQRDSANQ